MKKWTIIMQISGENNLLLDSISAFNEISGTGSTNEINFVVVMDRMQVIGELPEEYKQYTYLKNEALAHPSVYLIKKNETYDRAKPHKIFENDNLNDKKNLTAILTYIKEEFKAENYGFIYKGHGAAGSTDIDNVSFITKLFKVKKDEYDKEGKIIEDKLKKRLAQEKIETDETYKFSEEYFVLNDEEKYPSVVLAVFTKGKTDCMKYTDLENILTNTFGNNGLEFLLMDCCWAMILENIHQFKDLTKNFIASEDEMPALGIGYTHFTEFITQKPDIKPYELAKMMVAVYYTKRFDDYNDPSDPSFKNMGVSLTCVDTKAYKNFVLDPFIKLVSTLTNNMRLYAKDIFKSLSCCKDFTYVKSKYTYAMFNLDIIWFFENLAYFTNDEKLKNSIYETILNIRLYLIKGYMENNYKETKLGGLFNGGKGIAVTLPKTERYYNYSTMGDPDFDIPFFKETKWREMVLRFYEYNFKTEIFLTAAIKNMDNPELISLINDSPFESGSFYNDLSLAVNAIQSNNKTDHSLESFTNLQKQIDYIDTEKFFSVFTPEFTKSLEPPQALLEGLNLNIREKWKKL